MISLSSLNDIDKEKMMMLMASSSDDDLRFEGSGDDIVAVWNIPQRVVGLPLVQYCLSAKAPVHTNPPKSTQHGSIQNTKLFKRVPNPSEIQGEIRAVQWTIKLIEDIWSQYCKGISEGSPESTENLYSFIFHYFTHKFGLDTIVENTFADLIYNSQRYYHISTVCEIFCMLINGEYNDLDLRFFAIARSHLIAASVSEVRAVQASDSHRHNVLRRFVPIRDLSHLMKKILFKHPHASYVRTRVSNWLESPDTLKISPRALVKAGHVDCYELLRFLLSIYADNPRDVIPASASAPLRSVDVNALSTRKPQHSKRQPSTSTSTDQPAGYTMSEKEVVDIHVLGKKNPKQQRERPTSNRAASGAGYSARTRRNENEGVVVRDINSNQHLSAGSKDNGPSKTKDVFRKMAMLEVSHRSVSETFKTTSSELPTGRDHILRHELNEYFSEQHEVRTHTSDAEFTRRSSLSASVCDNETDSNATAKPTPDLIQHHHQQEQDQDQEPPQSRDTTPVDEDLIFGIAKVPTATTESWRADPKIAHHRSSSVHSFGSTEAEDWDPNFDRPASTSLTDCGDIPSESRSKFIASPKYEYEADSNFDKTSNQFNVENPPSSSKAASDQCANETIESITDYNNEGTYSNTKWDHQHWEGEDENRMKSTSFSPQQSNKEQASRSQSGSPRSRLTATGDETDNYQKVDKYEARSQSGGSGSQMTATSNPSASDEQLPVSTDNRTDSHKGRWTSVGLTSMSVIKEGGKESTDQSNWRSNDQSNSSPQRSPARWRLSKSESPQSEKTSITEPPVDLAEDKSPRRGGTWRDASRVPRFRPELASEQVTDIYNVSNITSSTSSDDVEVNLAKLQAEVSHLKKLQARLQGNDFDDAPINDIDGDKSSINEKSIISQKCDPETEEMDSVPAELLGEGGLMLSDKEVDVDSDDRQFYTSLTAALQRRKERDSQQRVQATLSKEVPEPAFSFEDDLEFQPYPRETADEAISNLEKLALSDSF